jgi:hypothetical protein
MPWCCKSHLLATCRDELASPLEHRRSQFHLLLRRCLCADVGLALSYEHGYGVHHPVSCITKQGAASIKTHCVGSLHLLQHFKKNGRLASTNQPITTDRTTILCWFRHPFPVVSWINARKCRSGRGVVLPMAPQYVVRMVRVRLKALRAAVLHNGGTNGCCFLLKASRQNTANSSVIASSHLPQVCRP